MRRAAHAGNRLGALLLALALAPACGGGDGARERQRAAAPELETLFRVEGFDHPESVAWDAPRNRWLVTNRAGGEPGSGAGFVSAVSAAGDSVVRRAIGGPGGSPRLDGPTGIAVRDDRAYVVDRTRLVALDLTDGSLLWSVALPDPGFPNDVALGGDGTIYVSDTGANRIWRIAPDGSERERMMPTVSLRSPNGLLFEATHDSVPGRWRLLVAGWEGTVMALNADSSVTLLAESSELERLDGIQHAPDGGLLVTDYARGRLQHLQRGDTRVWRAGVPWLTGLDQPADFLVRDTILAVPEMGAGRVVFYRLPRD